MAAKARYQKSKQKQMQTKLEQDRLANVSTETLLGESREREERKKKKRNWIDVGQFSKPRRNALAFRFRSGLRCSGSQEWQCLCQSPKSCKLQQFMRSTALLMLIDWIAVVLCSCERPSSASESDESREV
jgi:hypothetical protein